MNVHGSLWLALPLAFLLPLGCNNAAPTGQASEGVASEPAVAAEPAAAATAHGHGHWRHHASVVRQMLHASRSLDLSDAQKATVDGLSAGLHGERAGAPPEQQAMHAALVDGVRAGKIDLVKLAPLQTAASSAHQARAARETAALNGLYAALQPAQRQALVATVRERQAERATRWASHQKEQPAGEIGEHRLAHLTSQLGLDAAQQQSVQAILAANRPAPAAKEARHEAVQARNEALFNAFTGDGFDASKFELAPPADAQMGPAQHAQFLSQLVPILRVDQRETLAASMEKPQNER